MTDTTAVVACFNYGAFVGEAVRSLLEQEGGAAPRVIVVDDGSTEPATHAALDALPPEVLVVRQQNAGVSAARNAGIALAETEYVLCLDADDRLAPGALALLRAALAEHPDTSFAYGHHQYFGDWNNLLKLPPYDALRLLDRHLIGLTTLARREVFEATGGFDPAFDAYEDWELWVHALASGHRGVRVDAATLEYRRHGASKISADRGTYRRMRRQLLQKHAPLYRSRRTLARESTLGAGARLVYRWYWGPRPLPGGLERAIYDAVFSRR